MLDAFDDLLDRLEGVRRRGNDQADARCPAHDDSKASLSVARGRDGRTLLQCHAGCDWHSVLTALGLSTSAAFGEPHMVAEYTYTDAAGTPLYVVERWEPKTFKQRLANGHRRTPTPENRVLYNLPVIENVRASVNKSLFYTEGERDVHTLSAKGYAATTSLGGANKPWQPQYTEALAGMHVVIVADNDAPGRKWARAVAEHLHPQATTAIVVPPSGIKDVTELLDAGYDVTDLRPLPDTHGETATALDYPIQQVEWLWPGRLPKGMLTLLEGDPGTGKSTITIEIIACLTTGRPLPGVMTHLAPLRVAMLADEDSWPTVVVPRLTAAGADLSKVIHLKGIREGDYLKPYMLAELAPLRHDIMKLHADVLVIDPIMAYLGGADVDSYRDQHVRSVLGPLVQMAEEDNVTVIAIRHFTKGSAGGKAIYRGGGSIGFTGQARAILQTAEHPEGDSMVLAVAKCNLAPLAPSLGYHVVIDTRLEVGRIKWEDIPVRFTAQQLQSGFTEAPTTKKDEAAEWLDDYLSDGQAHTWQEIVAAAAGKHAAKTLVNARNEGVAIRVLGSAGMASAKWKSATCPPDPALKSGSSGSSGPVEGQVGWTPTTVLDQLGVEYEDDDERAPARTASHLTNDAPLDPLDPLSVQGQKGQVGTSTPLDPLDPHGQVGSSCNVCGSADGLIEYPSQGLRCPLHSPLVWTAP